MSELSCPRPHPGWVSEGKLEEGSSFSNNCVPCPQAWPTFSSKDGEPKAKGIHGDKETAGVSLCGVQAGGLLMERQWRDL